MIALDMRPLWSLKNKMDALNPRWQPKKKELGSPFYLKLHVLILHQLKKNPGRCFYHTGNKLCHADYFDI